MVKFSLAEALSMKTKIQFSAKGKHTMAAFKPASNIIGINAFLIAIATTVLLLRFISRKLSDAGFWWDDWLVLAAWVRSLADDPRSDMLTRS